jgi:predicted ATPase
MIDKLTTKNFSVLKNQTFSFARGINVVIGTNASGKSHLLKLVYSLTRWSYEMHQRDKSARPDKATQQKELGRKLMAVFGCETVGRLATRAQGVKRAEVSLKFRGDRQAHCAFNFTTRAKSEVILEKAPEHFSPAEAVFFPTKEVMSMFPGFASLYRERELQIDETYYDLCLALEKPLSRGPRLEQVRPMLEQAEEIIGGRVTHSNGRFYLTQPGEGIFEMPLVAEGYRKLAMIAYLLANGTLTRQSILFWDEPETNLNPAAMTRLAALLSAIARNGTQLFIATHSLFLMRELSLLLATPEYEGVDARYFALDPQGAGQGVRVITGDSADEIEPIAALEAEIEQSERYLQAEAGVGR